MWLRDWLSVHQQRFILDREPSDLPNGTSGSVLMPTLFIHTVVYVSDLEFDLLSKLTKKKKKKMRR